jgi:hypothetical protein
MNPNLEPVVYNGFLIRPRLTPLKSGRFALVVTVEEQGRLGSIVLHNYDRPEEFDTSEQAHAAGIEIGRWLIDSGKVPPGTPQTNE